MTLEGSRILVTGGSGLIGSHIVEQLIAERTKEIIIFDQNISFFKEVFAPKMNYGNITLFQGDIRNLYEVRETLKGVDFVIHTAALLLRGAGENFRTAFEVNVCGTFNLLEASLASKVKKFIYSSSISIYEEPLMNPMNEEHPLKTTSIYGASKVSCEMFLRAFRKMKGLDYVALRYALVYGPRQHYGANLALYILENFDRIGKGLPPIIYGDGSQIYDYIHVEDVARANVLALKSSAVGESFNIATGVSTAVKDVVQMIREITGTALDPGYAPRGNRFALKDLFLDVTKAQKLMGFRACIPLREGLNRYYNWRKTGRDTKNS